MEKKSSSKSVVGEVRMPKFKMTGTRAAVVNAAAVAVAGYFGVVAIFGAIAGFTKGSWVFDVPGIVSTMFGGTVASISLFGTSISAGASMLFITMMIAFAAGLIGLFTLKKLTDAAAVKKAWAIVAEIFGVIFGLLVIGLVATAVYSLLGLGEKSGVSQGDLWLSSFLPLAIKAVVAFGMYIIARKIAAGKLEVLRIFSMVTGGIAAVAFVLVLVQTLVGFYGKKTSSSVFDDDYDYDWSSILDY